MDAILHYNFGYFFSLINSNLLFCIFQAHFLFILICNLICNLDYIGLFLIIRADPGFFRILDLASIGFVIYFISLLLVKLFFCCRVSNS